jgi:coenzyme PQQ biosynthesis protein C
MGGRNGRHGDRAVMAFTSTATQTAAHSSTMSCLSPEQLESALRDIGAKRYHRLHAFHRLLHGGKCTTGQVQAWALNRYYYQAMIPVKDASLIARCEDPMVRRAWRSRLIDPDGERDDGGIARWLKLTDGLGVDREYVTSMRDILPGTRFAVEAYVHFVRDKSLLEAIASSLTELFSPAIISERVEGMLKGYAFVTADTLAYFAQRPSQAQRDSDFALDYVKRHAQTPAEQQAVLKSLEFKCDVLWAMLDALCHAYVEPKHVPPGAFVPADHEAT